MFKPSWTNLGVLAYEVYSSAASCFLLLDFERSVIQFHFSGGANYHALKINHCNNIPTH